MFLLGVKYFVIRPNFVNISIYYYVGNISVSSIFFFFPFGHYWPHDTVNSFSVKGPIHSQVNWAILLCDVIPEEKTEQTAQIWQAIAQTSELSFPVVFHTENCAV
jgi:hypothetical protein